MTTMSKLTADQKGVQDVAVVLDGRLTSTWGKERGGSQQIGQRNRRPTGDTEVAASLHQLQRVNAARIRDDRQDLGRMTQELMTRVGNRQAARMTLEQ